MGEFLKGSSRRSGRYPAMDQPPNSRLFVLCDKNSTEQDLIDHFSPYGTVEYCKIIRDKITNASKGFCYVKFDRASAAANALERANASLVADSQFPIKIEKASSAALALESVNESGQIEDMRVKVLVADPKARRRASDPPTTNWSQSNQWDASQQGIFVPSYPAPPPVEMPPFYVPYLVPPVMQVHFLVEFDASVPTEQVQALFAGFEGFETCFFDRTIETQGDLSKARAHIYFTDPQRAMVAVEKAKETTLGSFPLRCSWEDPYAPPSVPNYYPVMLPPYPPYPYPS